VTSLQRFNRNYASVPADHRNAQELVRFDDWRDKRRVKGKLDFTSIRIGRIISGPCTFLGVLLSSGAAVEIEVDLIEARTRIDNRVPKETTFKVTPIVVPPHGTGWFNDHEIEVNNPPHPGTLEGFVEFIVEYGRVGGGKKFEFVVKKQAVLSFDASGIFAGGSWHDAA
jgi:hypothetical protein